MEKRNIWTILLDRKYKEKGYWEKKMLVSFTIRSLLFLWYVFPCLYLSSNFPPVCGSQFPSWYSRKCNMLLLLLWKIAVRYWSTPDPVAIAKQMFRNAQHVRTQAYKSQAQMYNTYACTHYTYIYALRRIRAWQMYMLHT